MGSNPAGRTTFPGCSPGLQAHKDEPSAAVNTCRVKLKVHQLSWTRVRYKVTHGHARQVVEHGHLMFGSEKEAADAWNKVNVASGESLLPP